MSPKKFTNWLLKKSKKKKLTNYLKTYGGYSGKDWLKKNKKNLFSSKLNNLKELYIPRAILNLWMEEKLILLISKMKRISKKLSIPFNIKFFKGEVVRINDCKTNYRKIIFKNNFCEKLDYQITNNPFKRINFKKIKREEKSIFSITQNIGLGLPPPKQLATLKAQKNIHYIWDFYSQGSTALLIKKISNLNKKKKKLLVYFIGYKAGLLESLPELRKVIINKKNLGYAGGYNEGVKNIKADYYVFINNDVEVTSNWLNPLFNKMESNSNIGACQPKILSEKKLPDFFPGDIIKVGVRITEGKRDRIQYFEGVCIAKKNRDLNSSFTVRKISFGEGVERTFALYSAIVDSIKVIRSGKVRRAKLYYLRDRTGKSARITEKIRKKIGIDVESKPEEVTEENLAPVVEEKTADKQETSEDKSEAPKAETKKEEIKKDTPEEKK